MTSSKTKALKNTLQKSTTKASIKPSKAAPKEFDKTLNPSSLILAIDQGTTGTTAVFFDQKGKAVAKGYCEIPQHYPKPAWVEHDPKDILKSVTTSIREAIKVGKINTANIAAIGITNQRETVVGWNPLTGKSSHNAIVWQCRRTSEFTEKLKKDKTKSQKIFKTTGLVVDPYFSSSKISWLLKNKHIGPNDLVGTIDSFLVWNLTGGEKHITDVSNASRTQLMSLKTLAWDKEMLKLFKIPEKILPTICSSSGIIGHTKGFEPLPDGIPITGLIGDQQSALFGQGAVIEGNAKCTFGTGSFILMNIGQKVKFSTKKLLTTVAWKIGDEKPVYAFEGGAFVCGAAVQFLRDQLKFIKSAKDVEDWAKKANQESLVQCVPAYSGLGAPFWNPDARAAFLGMSRGDGIAELCLATLEGMALQNSDIITAMEKDAKFKLKSLNVDGGASSNDLLMQLQADVLGSYVVRPQWIESTSRGAAFLAGHGIGLWSLKDIKKIIEGESKKFSPKANAKWRGQRLKSWQKAVGAVQLYSKPKA